MKKIIGLLSLCLVLFLGTNAKGRPIGNIVKSNIKASYSSSKLVKELNRKEFVVKKVNAKKESILLSLLKNSLPTFVLQISHLQLLVAHTFIMIMFVGQV